MKILRRFLRIRSGIWWVLPTALVLIALTVTHNALTRFDPTRADSSQWRFGGHSQGVYFNELVPTTEKSFKLDQVLDSLQPNLSSTACSKIQSILSDYTANQKYFSYTEYLGSCSSQDWGFQLFEGRYSNALNEVVATPDTGYKVGQTVSNLLPKPFTVVGLVSNENADTARVLIAHSGTFRDFGWPETKLKWPALSANVSTMLDGFDQGKLESHFLNLNSSVAFDYLDTPRKTLSERFPYLYLWVALPLILVAMLFSLLLRSPFVRRRVKLLVSQGASPFKASSLLLVSNIIHLAITGVLSICAGSLLSLALAEPVRWMSSRRLSPFPWPIDPATQFGLALLSLVPAYLLTTYSITLFGRLGSRIQRFQIGRKISWVISIVLTLLALASLSAPLFQLSYFTFVLLLVAALGFSVEAPLKYFTSRKVAKTTAGRLAFRRVSQQSTRSAVALTGATLAIAPVLTFLIMFSSALAQSNKSEVLPPDINQVSYAIFAPSKIDLTVIDLAMESAGADVSFGYYSNFSNSEGTPIVASESELGSVISVDSSASLESMLQTSLTPLSVETLNSGGILWLEENDSTDLWTLSNGDLKAKKISFSGATYQQVPWAWQNSARAVVLDKTLEKLGLVKDYKTLIVSGITRAESLELADSLLKAGIDPSIVEYHKEGDAYSETPLQVGITFIMFLMATILILSSTRSIVSSLRNQSRELVSLGVPSSWMAKVFFTEMALTVGVGLVIGLILTAIASGLAITSFNIVTSVPWLYIAVYGFVVTGLVTFVSWSGLRRIRS
jgi:hypothetical protein